MVANTDGLIVDVGVDSTGLKSGLADAQNQVKQFAQGTNAALGTTQEAMAGASAAAEKTKNSTRTLGEQLRETGSRRELSESMKLLRAASEGTTGAFDALRVILVTFATSLGGPALIAITATIAVLGALYEAVHNAGEAQKQLNLDAEALHLPANELKQFTSAMKDLAQQIVAVQLGFGHFSQAQVDIFKQLGIDPKSAGDAKKVFDAIYTSVGDLQAKINAYAIATGKSLPDATKDWDAHLKEVEQKAKDTALALARLAGAGAQLPAGLATQFQQTIDAASASLKEGSSGVSTPTGDNAQHQEQLDEEKKFQDQLFEIRKASASAHVAAMQDEVQKILAQAKIEHDALVKQQQDTLKDTTLTDDHRKQIVSALGDEIAAKDASAQQRANQVQHQAALDEEKAYRTQLAAIDKASDDATAAASTSAGDKIRNDAQQRIAALKKMLDDYFSSAEFQKLNAADQATKRGALTDQFNSASNTISSSADARGRKADEDQQLAQEKEFQSALNSLTNEGEEARISAITNTHDQILALGQQRIDKLEQQYEQDLDNLRKNVTDKQQLEEHAAILTAARDDAAAKIHASTAKKAADEDNKAITQLMQNWSDSTKATNQVWAGAMQDMADGSTNFVMGVKTNWGDMARSIIADLIKIQIEKELAGIFGSIGASGFSSMTQAGSGLTGSTIGMAATGGYISGPTIVGERGTEVFDPAMNRIDPNYALPTGSGGSTMAVQVSIVNNGTAQQVQSAQATQTPSGIVTSIVLDDIRRDGPMSQGIRSAYGLRKGGA